jgi:succinate dehydrogenase / fumarate reductase cytochrome b subunit
MATSVIGVRQERPARFLASTNGKKIVMAVTGVILFGFVIGHMLGNLQFFEDPSKIDAYGRFLKSVPELLWGVRIVLLLSVLLHIWASIGLALKNNSARPKGYARKTNTVSTYASRTMYWSGPILFCFIVYHLLHFTVGIVHPGADFKEGAIHYDMVQSFSVWYVSAWYIFAMILLGLHIGTARPASSNPSASIIPAIRPSSKGLRRFSHFCSSRVSSPSRSAFWQVSSSKWNSTHTFQKAPLKASGTKRASN